jgi:hypothetical protein
MNIAKNILSVLSIVLLIVLVYMSSKPTDTNQLEILNKKNDSLNAIIENNKLKIDSLVGINNELDSQRNVLKIRLGKVDLISKKLKEQHEKDIQYLNSLSNNDITELFSDKFADIQ